MRSALKRVRSAFSSSSSSRDNSSQGDRSHDSSRSSSYMPPWHGAGQSSHTPAWADEFVVTSDDDISIQTQVELCLFETLRGREFTHTRVYDVGILERTRMDAELPEVFHSIEWSKLYEEPRAQVRVS